MALLLLALSFSEVEGSLLRGPTQTFDAIIKGYSRVVSLRAIQPNSATNRDLKELEGYGSNPDESMMPLKLCQGDCDDDTDCEGDLICFERKPRESVPGCIGGEDMDAPTDFCIMPINETQTDAPAGIAVSGEVNSEQPQLNFIGNSNETSFLLGLCEGDCDSDSDCSEGLTCFERDAGQSVPGCLGNDNSRNDYCISFATTADSPTSIPDTTPEMNEATASLSKPTTSTTLFETYTPTNQDLPTRSPLFLPTSRPSIVDESTAEPTMQFTATEVITITPYNEISPEASHMVDTELTSTGAPTYLITNSNSPTEVFLPEFSSEVSTSTQTQTISGTIPPSISKSLPELDLISNNDGELLGECQGDCDGDEDCEHGLVCMQRLDLEDIPGCQGKQVYGADYCVREYFMTDTREDAVIAHTSPSSTQSPTALPTVVVTMGGTTEETMDATSQGSIQGSLDENLQMDNQ